MTTNAAALFRTVSDVETKLRAFIFGPAGSGKTTTALQVALGLTDGDASRVCLLDSEHGSAAKAGRDLDAGFIHADVNAFRALLNRGDLVEFDPRIYEAAIREAASRYDVVIVDSLSHAWEATIALKEKIGDSWGAWKTITPIWRSLIETILTAPAHVICTGRAKTKREMSNERGKRDLKTVGVVPVVRDGTEYEFDLVLRMTDDHTAVVEKARSVEFSGAYYDRPGPDLGRKLAAWLAAGGEDPAVWLARELSAVGLGVGQLDAWRKFVGKGPMVSLTAAQQRQTVAWLVSNPDNVAKVKAHGAQQSAPPQPSRPSADELVEALTGMGVNTDALGLWLAANGIASGLDGLGDQSAGEVWDHIANGTGYGWIREPWEAAA